MADFGSSNQRAPTQSANFNMHRDPSSFEALIAFELMARACLRHRRHGRVYSLQQHSAEKKEGGNYNFISERSESDPFLNQL